MRLYVIKTHNLLPPPGVQPRDLNPYVKARTRGQGADTCTFYANAFRCVEERWRFGIRRRHCGLLSVH